MKLAGFEHRASVRAIDLDSKGLRLLTGSDDGTARVWDAQTGKPLCAPLDQEAPLNVVRFSPNGRCFVTATSDETFLPRYARVWSAETFEPLTPKLWHQDGVLDAAFSPDGKILATAGEDNVLQLWDAFSGVPLSPRLRQPQKVDYVSFSPDGKLLLISCRSSYLRVYHAATGEPVSDLIPHGASEALPTFLPDSSRISFAGSDGRPVDLPIGSCAIPVVDLRIVAELLANHSLSERGLQRLDLTGVQARKAKVDEWNSTKPLEQPAAH
jgi:WD40 repeat protein